jgi:hypothetical protein
MKNLESLLKVNMNPDLKKLIIAELIILSIGIGIYLYLTLVGI